MLVCQVCGEENPDRAKFCLNCAAPLAVPGPGPAEERKVVSVLFADLVGFTSRSESADPEDVRAILRPYHARLKREIERYGGVVEKFVGDAVMAVFGAPVAHEDDAERAVRAALRIQEAIAELNEADPGLDLSVRAAVNTGEAVVTLGARPELGEGMVAGDVVNTASRLQAVAPEGGVLVGEATRRATGDLFVYEALAPVTVKGKAQPVSVWLARSARSRYGVDVRRKAETPLIGREDELELLRRTFARAVREPSIQLVTITGEPGVGKSRLVAELFTHVDDAPDIAFWRQGRCLPYGEGVTFWALGEVVKAQAGILESDSPEEAAAKLDVAVQAVVEDVEDRDWVRARLAPLVGLALDPGETVERGESFTAWRRFLESIASRSPLVVVFEDVHWADDALLEFIDHLVEYSTDVPLFVLCTARPELFERIPGWGGGKRNTSTLSLSPLTEAETGRLVSALLSEAALPDATQRSLLERSGGNPLYAEEFVRMLTDAGLLVRTNGEVRLGHGTDIPVPDTVQALIAARLDTVPAERKGLLHDASVVGKVFWSGVLSTMGRVDDTAVRDGLHELSRKELVRPARTSSVKDQAEYSFWHLLVRDVAYSQIPRAARAAKHLAAAAWIEGIAGERVADHAELLAHHYGQALGLARATWEATEAATLEEPARRFFELAGDRALALDVGKADSFYGQALELAPDGVGRARLLAKQARTAYLSNRLAESERSAEEAAETYLRMGDRLGEAEALLHSFMSLRDRGETARGRDRLARAVERLEGEPPGPELVRAYEMQARDSMMASAPADGLAWAEKGLRLARDLGREDLVLMVLWRRGQARAELADERGIDDIRESLRRSLELGLSWHAGLAYNALGDATWLAQGPEAGIAVFREGIAFTERRGLTFDSMWMRGSILWPLYEAGRWDEVLDQADQLVTSSRESGSGQIGMMGTNCRGIVLVRRGEIDSAASLMEEWLPVARGIEDPQMLMPALTVTAMIERSRGEGDRAVALLREMAEVSHGRGGSWVFVFAIDPLRLCSDLGELGLGRSLIEGAAGINEHQRSLILTARAILSEGGEDFEGAAQTYADAAQAWSSFGNVVEDGQALLGQGRCLVALGRLREARDPLEAARAVFERLGARPLVEETDRVLAAADGSALEPR